MEFLDACEIMMDRGQGYAALVTDTTPDYNDSHAFPATESIWRYQAIYRVDDAQFAQWSQEVSVTVKA